MLNTVYRLVAPRRFEVEFNDIDLHAGQIVVRPTHLSICHADQRYYQGVRPAEVLKEKLPMALIHEGLGEVLYDPTGTYQCGDTVIMIPNTPCEKDEVIAENYLRSSKFRASGFDGFMQEYVALDIDRVVPVDDSIDKVIAAFTELVSVSVHAIRRFDSIAHKRRKAVGIWGDGNLGYITAIFFKAMIPNTKLYILGVDQEKLSGFSFADDTFPYRISRMISILIMHLNVSVGLHHSRRSTRSLIISSRKERFLFWGYQNIRFRSIHVWS